VKRSRLIIAAAFCLLAAAAAPTKDSRAAGLPETVKRVKPSIVGVGTYQELRRPRAKFQGTGFVVADGRHVLTNAHVVSNELEIQKNERFAIFVGSGRNTKSRVADKVAVDAEHDVALLRIDGAPLPALSLGRDEDVAEGQSIAFTGFPIGSVLGLYPVTHQGIISARTPIAIPRQTPGQLNAAAVRRLRSPFLVFQLDATAYPGNSGSPVYDPRTGDVVAIISSVFVKKSKENVLKDPSGITYAVLVRYARALMEKAGVKP
jgi:S1-C subfamily serine protease